jgi:hypothetical protein
MKTLEERIAALEKANRRWRYALVVVCATAAGIAAAKPAATTDLLRTRRFEVVDGAGNIVVEINGAGARVPGAEIALLSSEGKRRIALLAGTQGGILSVLGDEGNTSIQPASLVLYADYQRELANLTRGEDLSAMMNQHRRVELGMSDKGDGYIHVLNHRGERRIAAFSSLSGMRGGGLMVINDDNKPAIFAYTSKSGGGMLDVYGARGKKAITAGAGELDEGFVITLRNNGQVGEALSASP